MQAYCGGRRSCLLAKLDADSNVMESLARQFRNIEVCAVGADDRVQLMWGRGKEVGETLEDDEEVMTDLIIAI